MYVHIFYIHTHAWTHTLARTHTHTHAMSFYLSIIDLTPESDRSAHRSRGYNVRHER